MNKTLLSGIALFLGWLQKGHECGMITQEAEAELAQAKKDNPDVEPEQAFLKLYKGDDEDDRSI